MNIAYCATNYSGKYGWIGIIWILTEKYSRTRTLACMHTHKHTHKHTHTHTHIHIDMAMYVSQHLLNIVSRYSALCVSKWLYRPSDVCLKILQPIIYPTFSTVLVTMCIVSKQ